MQDTFEPMPAGPRRPKNKMNQDPWYHMNHEEEMEELRQIDLNKNKNKEIEKDLCFCGMRAHRHVSRTEQNFMRPFLACPKEAGSRCWRDQRTSDWRK
eukprot:Skav224863  [mRNA]  locus=scaffold322:381038:381331:+ [translate_table: standard]